MALVNPILPLSRARIFYGQGLHSRLDHPEGIAVQETDGSVWCGGEAGQVYRIAPDGSTAETVVAAHGGFTLGMAFSPVDGDLYYIDVIERTVSRLPVRDGKVATVLDGSVEGRSVRILNALAFDSRGTLYITDSHEFRSPGPGIYRVRGSAEPELWCEGPFDFANGVCVAQDDTAVFVAESFGQRITRIPIEPTGAAGSPEVYADFSADPSYIPDGVAIGPDGKVYASFYNPHVIVRIPDKSEVELFIEDPDGHLLTQPSNIAWRGSTLFAANLGRWHITAIETDAP